uniref:Alkylated DNA repair protein AlkB homologue 8 N-terminal domain-containing protein n=1 Tax=Knipowitschia caucasica TaxID=637954 RepID=A0AAV2L6E9_KNICA
MKEVLKGDSAAQEGAGVLRGGTVVFKGGQGCSGGDRGAQGGTEVLWGGQGCSRGGQTCSGGDRGAQAETEALRGWEGCSRGKRGASISWAKFRWDRKDPLERLVLSVKEATLDLLDHPENKVYQGLEAKKEQSHDSVKLIKFADDTTLIGLISNNDESAYRREVDRLVSWCSGNNLELNAQKTVEMIVDFRKSTVPPPPPSVMDSPITSVESFRFLGTTITQDLKWEPTISSLIKKAQQRMYFLRQLRKAKLPAQMLVQFYTAIIESILTSSITVWFAGATVRDKQRLQRIVRSAEEVIGRSLPSLQDLLGT